MNKTCFTVLLLLFAVLSTCCQRQRMPEICLNNICDICPNFKPNATYSILLYQNGCFGPFDPTQLPVQQTLGCLSSACQNATQGQTLVYNATIGQYIPTTFQVSAGAYSPNVTSTFDPSLLVTGQQGVYQLVAQGATVQIIIHYSQTATNTTTPEAMTANLPPLAPLVAGSLPEICQGSVTGMVLLGTTNVDSVYGTATSASTLTIIWNRVIPVNSAGTGTITLTCVYLTA